MANTEYKVPRGTLTRTRQLIETVIAKLQETGRYEDVDRAMLELLTSSYDKMLRADDTLRKEGMTIIGARGTRQEHPAFKIWKSAQAAAFQILREMGVTVVRREQMPALKSSDDEDDPLKTLMRK